MRSVEEKNAIAIECAEAMLDNDWTLWQVSSNTMYPMSSLYKIMMERLPYINDEVYVQVRTCLNSHKGRRK